MFSSPIYSKLNNTYTTQGGYMILFGILSVVFSKIQFHIPEVGNSDLREIPLLIALFHLPNPIFIAGLCVFTLSGSPPNIPILMIISVHLVPLLFASWSLRLLERKELPDVVMGMVWMMITVVYYLVFLIPLVIISVNNRGNFLGSYLSILPSIRFELIASAMVTGLYLIQIEIRKTLEHNNKNLEKVVEHRTSELTDANNELHRLNKELVGSNNEIKELNENLEKMIKDRTDKINVQLNQLMRYAHMNSHQVRAPLARMLGLLQLIKREDDADQLKDLLNKLFHSSSELDIVIKEMNRLLEREVEFNEK